MFSKVYSGGILGIEGYLVHVEADVSDGLPGFAMVGYLASEVKEAQDRVRTALKNSGFRLPARKITINLSPADIRKDGTAYDLPIAVAVLAASGVIRPELLEDALFVGELGLNGELKAVHGALPLAIAAQNGGIRRIYLPGENEREAAVVEGIQAYGADDLKGLIALLESGEAPGRPIERSEREEASYDVDYSEVKGQYFLRRATEIAAAGKHNILYIGPAGTGKSMIAQRIPTILPPLTREEQIEISKIYSIKGMLSSDTPLIQRRPYRSPHHTISPQTLTGGGRIPKPGELSLASGGVLFLDEFSEFQRSTIEVLRQPLEERAITVSRVRGSVRFPADFLLAAAMNPCPCGYYPDPEKCRCTPGQIRRYLDKLSKPLLDRIDLFAAAAPVTYEELHGTGRYEDSRAIRTRVERAWEIQRQRFLKCTIHFNSEMNAREIQRHCRLNTKEAEFLKQAYQSMQLSARAYHKILKVARTIADLDGREQIGHSHLCESIGLRGAQEKYWGRRTYD